MKDNLLSLGVSCPIWSCRRSERQPRTQGFWNISMVYANIPPDWNTWYCSDTYYICCNLIMSLVYFRDLTKEAKNQSLFYGSIQEMTSQEWLLAPRKLQRRVKRYHIWKCIVSNTQRWNYFFNSFFKLRLFYLYLVQTVVRRRDLPLSHETDHKGTLYWRHVWMAPRLWAS